MDLLRAINAAYLGIAGLRNRFYDWRLIKGISMGVPVISIGNLSWGGTGKTEFVKWIAKWCFLNNRKPLILYRGYGCRLSAYREVGLKDISLCDEPGLVKKALPGAYVFIGPKRERLIQMAMEKYKDIGVVILDDGFQYRRLKRDMDIVLISRQDRFFREPMSSLGRANLVVITKLAQESLARDFADELSSYTSAPIIAADYENSWPQAGSRVIAVCAIARPNHFISAARSAGLDVVREFVYRDHYIYRIWDVMRMVRVALDFDAFILTTPKDAVKLERFSALFEKKGVGIFVSEPSLRFLWGEQTLKRLINGVLG